jgi:heme-degrading monooxygenase HmoA
MSYIRHTIVSVQPGKKDAFLSQLITQLDSIKSMAGLMGIKVVNAGNNRVIGTTVYDSKESSDAASQKAAEVREGTAQLLTDAPFVREGEVAWRYMAEGVEGRPAMPGFARHLAVGYEPSKFEAMLAYLESQTGLYQSIDGLRRILVTPISGSEGHPQFRERIGNLDNRMIVTAGYDSKSQSEAARDKVNALWKSMTEFLTGEPLVSEGEFVYGHRNR